MARRILDLREEETGRFPRDMLSDAQVLALNASGKFEVEPASVFNENKYGIRSQGWVGQIPVGDELLVRVAPKVSVSNLFRMLEVAYNLSSFHLFEGDIEIESIEDIYERIVSILARRVIDRARKGLYRSYVGEISRSALRARHHRCSGHSRERRTRHSTDSLPLRGTHCRPKRQPSTVLDA